MANLMVPPAPAAGETAIGAHQSGEEESMTAQSTGPGPVPPDAATPSGGFALFISDVKGLLVRPGETIPPLLATPGFGQ